MRRHVATRIILAFGLLVLALAGAPAAVGHDETSVGAYHVGVGWHIEPAFVGQPNAVEVTIHDRADKPVTDLVPGDLRVVVSTGDQQTAELGLEPAFDLAEAVGTPGQYLAALLPTTTGDYTFHVTGAIHDQAVDLTLTSGDKTFDPVTSSSNVEFPVKVPTLADVATRLDRIDARIQELQSGAGDPQDLASLQAAVTDARAAADRASTLGLLIGGAGVAIGLVALVVASRASRRGAGRA